MQVHHGKNEDDITILGIDNAERKTPHLAPTYVIFENTPGVWETEDVLYCRVDFDGEIVTEAWLAVFIIVYGVEKFLLSLGMKAVPHLVNRSSALSNTTSPGIGFTFPDRSS